MTNDELESNLKELRLAGICSHYLEMARVSEKKKESYEQYLGVLSQIELEARHKNKIKRLLKTSKLPLIKTLESYDYSKRKGITAKVMDRLAKGEFVTSAGNIVFYGSFGVGKTHLSIALVKKLCEKGVKCYYTSTNNLIEELLEAKKNLTLGSLWKRLDRYDVITCDELGYIPQTKEGADLFFQFISQRYERKSLIITTNLTYAEWDQVFLNDITTAAAVDRIIHTCETFNIEGPSWRAESASKKIKTKAEKKVQTK